MIYLRMKTIVDAANLAATAGNVRMLGKLYNKAQDRVQKGKILSFIALEHALRDEGPNALYISIHLINEARKCLVDEWTELQKCAVKESIIREACADRNFADGVIVGRAEAIKNAG